MGSRARQVLACAILGALCACRSHRAAARVMIDSARTTIAIRGLSGAQLGSVRRGSAAFHIRLIDDSTHLPLSTPVAGKEWVDGDAVYFRPSYRLAEGASYAIEFGAAAKPVTLRVPARTQPRPTVEAVYPTDDTLPENLLKFYVRFSMPMRHGFADTHLALLDDDGHVLRAFLRRDAELWDREDRTLSVFLDPARVKTGLVANRRLGRAMRAGHRYRLIIIPGWPSAAGDPLESGYVKRFWVKREDRAPLDERRWRLAVPSLGGRDPLLVRFGEPLDALLLEELFVLVDERGEVVAGRAAVTDAEHTWLFRPDRPWGPGHYAVVVGAELEDLAGNDLVESFDRPTTERRRERTLVRIPFVVPSPGSRPN